MRRWDIFCRVVDNFGDIGTCWRLAQQLANEHRAVVRLWVDRLESFARLCPTVLTDAAVQDVDSIEIRHWRSDFPEVDVADVADVVIEAFACELPENYLAAMTRRIVAPVWINLEYLSAEAWVEDCHLLTSPQPRSSLTKHFFFPGFSARTGGLLRERDLLKTRDAFDSAAATEFWSSLGIAPQKNGEIRVSLFCYANTALPELVQTWIESRNPIVVLASQGAATEQIAAILEETLVPGVSSCRQALTVHALPFLPQPDYDRLLWACDVNFVRGEDSFVRAQWAQRPFVWQIYPQADEAHLVKLEAFLERFLEKFDHSDVVRRCWRAWNGRGDIGSAWPEFVSNRSLIQQHGEVWAFQLDRLGNLANNLSYFACGK
ncbi:MAG: hypothetical protein JWM11_6651 [Planctomycetaceae bacterium]|nr:hypothetical protein [Planctomycetaceae bacterium]